MKNQKTPLVARRRGFTLIEMIGVLAIIAILAVVIAPKVFGAIRSSRINSTLVSIDSIKTATVDYVGKNGVLPDLGSATQRFDDLLIAAGMLDERFSSKVGTQTNTYASAGATWTRNATTGVWGSSGGNSQTAHSRIMSRVSTATPPATAGGRNFYLNGTTSLPTGSRVVYAVLVGVPEAEAREMSERVDGPTLSTAAGADGLGKIVYTAPSGGLSTVYVYMLHQ